MKFCPKCGRQIPEGSKACFYCQTRIEETDAVVTPVAEEAPVKPEKKANKLAVIIPIASVALVAVVFGILILTHVICLEHSWERATCAQPKTCEYCGRIEGKTRPHKWQEATCMEPKSCRNCGETKGKAEGHDWESATCIAPKTCAVCGETKGKKGEHDWQDATCTEPRTCKACGISEGKTAAHVTGEWEVLEAPTLESTGMDALYCTECGEMVDDRITNKKIPAVVGKSFNFNDKEFLEFLSDMTLVKSIDDSRTVSDGTTAYDFVQYDGVECYLILDHGNEGEDGNIYAICVNCEDPASAAVAVADIGQEMNMEFSADDAIAALATDRVYSKAQMSVLMTEEDDGTYTAMLLPSSYLAEIITE